MPDSPPAVPPPPMSQATAATAPRNHDWLFPLLRVVLVVAAGFLAWYVAGNWDRWTGAARFETTDDAYLAGDVTPLAAKVSGYVAAVLVGDYQKVTKGDLLVEIEGSDYRAQLAQTQANLAAANAALENLGNQKDVQKAIVRQAEATILATQADVRRYALEAERQRG